MKVKQSLPTVLSPEEKKYLRSYTRYLKALGMKEGLIEIDMDDNDFEGVEFSEIQSFSNNYKVDVTEELQQIFQKIFHFINDYNLWDENPDVNDINYRKIEIEVDVRTETISVSDFYTYYETAETESIEYDDEETLEPLFTLIREQFEEENKSESEVELSFNGSGDSGYIEDNFSNQVSVPADVQDWCYRELENHFGGWEINEGSQGVFYFYLDSETIILNFTGNIEESVSNTIFEEKFSN